MSEFAALGFRSHSGWAAVVAVSGWPGKPVVLERRRIETADTAIPGSKQPYHAGERLEVERAEELIRQCRDGSTRLAMRAVSDLVAQLQQNGATVVGAGILFASGRPLPNLAATLRSHALIHTAEGEFFREVLVRASEHCSLHVTKLKEREVWDQATRVFRLPAADLQERIGGLGRSLGPPWRQDEKLASLAAWIALAESM
ncbi:MAG TPA: hypothetical protein VKO18_22200 [Terriglobia bacterium]|nr:hypothetical protein [Terriglobia bacterium]